MATIDGTSGNDTLLGTTGDDLLNGLAGNDSIDGGEGNDTLDGGPGNDGLDGGGGDDLLIGGAGANTIDDAGGNDTVSYEGETAAITLNANRTVLHDSGNLDTISAAVERVAGTFFIDAFFGDGAGNELFAFSGNDTMNGLGGDDLLHGGRGNDHIFGGPGDDTLIGGLGNDLLIPEAGSDVIDVTQGQDTINFGFDVAAITLHPDNTVVQGAATKTILGQAQIIATPLDDNLNGGIGDDQFLGMDGNDIIAGGLGSDTLDGGNGNDSLNAGAGDRALLIGGMGNDTLNGSQTLIATASWATSPAGIMLLAHQGTAQDGFATTDTLIGVHSFIGSTHNDTMTAGMGLDGVVNFYGGGGNDVFGGGGFDISGTGLVRVRYDLEPAGGTIDLQAGTAQFPGHSDILIDIHDLVGTPFDDVIYSTFDQNIIDGGAGDDLITSYGGDNDSIIAGAGNDTVMMGLGGTASTIEMGSGADNFGLVLAGAPPPPAATLVTTVWQASGATTLMVSQSFDQDFFGSAFVGKSDGTLRLLLDPFDQIFDAAAYALGLILVPGGDLTGTLGQGNDIVLADAGAYSLDGGGGFNSLYLSNFGAALDAVFAEDGTITISDAVHFRHFAALTGTAASDSFTGPGLDAQAALGPALAIELLNNGFLSVPRIDGFGGNDSYQGAVAVDYGNLSQPIQIALSGQPGHSTATTSRGTDSLQANFGVYLPSANNTVGLGAQNVFLQVSGGSNSLTAGPGSLLSYDPMNGPLQIDLAQGRVEHDSGTDTIVGINNVIGSDGDDVIIGDNDDNVIAPGSGNNVVDGGGGADTLALAFALSAVAEQVYLRDSQRLLFVTLGHGPATADSVSQVESADFAGEMVAISSFARDLPDFAMTTAMDAAHPVLFTAAQNDDVDGSGGADVVLDRGGANRIAGEGGNDLIRMNGDGPAVSSLPPDLAAESPAPGDDELLGGDGADTILGGQGADIVDGGIGNDLLFGDTGADSIASAQGDDLLFGGAGDDLLVGEAGNDSLFGESGRDILTGGAGDDWLYADGEDLAVVGADGFDLLVIAANSNGLTVIDLEAFENQNQSGTGPTVSSIEAVDASLAATAVSLHGTAFDVAGSLLIGSGFGDTVVGGDGADTLVGAGGDDFIEGGLGNDSIILDAGNDTVTGGGGADAFAYRGGPAGAGIVQVMDFTPGMDRVVLPTGLATSASDALSHLAMTGDGAIFLADIGAGIQFVGVATASFTLGDFLIVGSL